MANRHTGSGPVGPRFWSKVEKTDTCWLWVAARANNGYGVFGIDGTKVARAHRVAWELTNGPIPAGAWVLHRCDVRNCVRPDHLWLGTRADNMTDAKAKGRMVSGDRYWARRTPEKVHRGERHWNVKLTDEQVAAIRVRLAAGETGVAVARAFDVSIGTVSMIRTGKRRRE